MYFSLAVSLIPSSLSLTSPTLFSSLCQVPSIGGLAHLLTALAYSSHLPAGTLQFLTGSGRKLLPEVMRSGDIDLLAFIGSSKAADQLIHAHPHVHRLKVFLQLEGKNVGVIAPDAFEETPNAIDGATNALEEQLVQQMVLGALSFNGQRCTALKLLFIPEKQFQRVTSRLAAALDALPLALPWDRPASGSSLLITPLPGNRVNYMNALLENALLQGGKVLNARGGQVQGNIMAPALVAVTPESRLFREEQFGPLVPVVRYVNMSEVVDYLRETEFGQQASLFSRDVTLVGGLVDKLSTTVGRINVNTQCARSPDVLPFSGRRSSAQGTMSVEEALKSFSVPVVVAGKQGISANEGLLAALDGHSTFLAPLSRGDSAGAPDL